MKVFNRTENGTTVQVTKAEGLAEINYSMMAGRRRVKTMSSINATDYVIEYKNGDKVRLELVEAPEVETVESGAEWSVTASNGSLLHRFGADHKAACNGRIRPKKWLREGVVLRTRKDVETSEFAFLYTFCPSCESK